MKKNMALRVAAFLLACCMFSLCTLTGTMAKYGPYTVSNGKQLRAGLFHVVAKGSGGWIALGGSYINDDLKINLYDTLYEAPADNTGKLGPAENLKGSNPLWQHVWENVIGEVIAPGNGGMIEVTVVNYSEVDVVVDVKLGDALESARPVEWWNGDRWQDEPVPLPTGDDAEAQLILKNFPSSGLAGALGTTSFELIWRWKFERGIEPNTPDDGDCDCITAPIHENPPTNDCEFVPGNAAWYYSKDAYDTMLGVNSASGGSPVLVNIPLSVRATQID